MLSHKDIFWGYSAQVLNIGFGVIILPVILYFLSTKEVGLWFVFMTLAGISQLLEMGFQPTIARNVSYIHAGAQKLTTQGIQAGATGSVDTRLLAVLTSASRWIYFRIAIVAAVLLLVFGTIYITSLLTEPEDRRLNILAWIIYSMSLIVNFYYGYIGGLLIGRGNQTQANQVIVTMRVAQLAGSILFISLGWGLMGLALAGLLSTILSRFIARRFLLSAKHPIQPNRLVTSAERDEMVKLLWFNASRYGTVLIGAFLTGRANILIASSVLGLEESASYALAVQLLIVLSGVASVPFNLSLPLLNKLRAENNKIDLYNCFSRAISLVLIISILGALAFTLLGPKILQAIGSKTLLPPVYLLGLMALSCVLEINHGNCANFLATSNTISFVRSSVFTGILIAISSFSSVAVFGTAALVISNLLCQMAFNNWKWPVEAAKNFNVSFFSILIDGMSQTYKNLKSASKFN